MSERNRYFLSHSEVLLVKGPSAVIPEEEGIAVLGMPIKPNEKIIVKENKILPFEIEYSSSTINVIHGKRGWSKICENKIGIRIWKNIIKSILDAVSLGKKKLIIIGRSDSGKSTLAIYLINMLLKKNFKVCVVDGDIGQGDLAPPGCIGATQIDNFIYDLRGAGKNLFEFIGFTSPRLVEHLVIDRINKLISHFEKNYDFDVCIINTDGYIDNNGLDYKIRMIDSVSPNIVVYFEDVAKIFTRMQNAKLGNLITIMAERPENISKTVSERNIRRLNQYLRFLKNGTYLKIHLNSVKINFMGYFFYDNASLEDLKFFPDGFLSNVLLIKKSNDRFLIFRNELQDTIEIFDKHIIFNLCNLRGMFVGLGLDEKVLGFAKITKVHPDLSITLNTRFDCNFNSLFLSTIKIIQNLTYEIKLPIIMNKTIN